MPLTAVCLFSRMQKNRDSCLLWLVGLMLVLPACHFPGEKKEDRDIYLLAEQKRSAGTVHDLQEALVAYASLSDKAFQSRQPAKALNALFKAGEIDLLLAQPQQALARYEKANSFQFLLNRTESFRLKVAQAAASIATAEFKSVESLLPRLSSEKEIVNDALPCAEMHQMLGGYYYQTGAPDQAIAEYSKSVACWERTSEKRNLAWVRMHRGQAYSDLGKAKEALADLEGALAQWQALQDRRGQAQTLAYLGRLHTRRGDQQAARVTFEQAQQIAEVCGDTGVLALVQSGQGFIFETMGLFDQAIEKYRQSLGLSVLLTREDDQAELWHEIGRAHYLMGNYASACHAFTLVQQMARTLKNEKLRAHALRGLGMVFVKTSATEAASAAYEEALPLLRQAQDQRGQAYLLNLIGQLHEEQGDLMAAHQALTAALTLCLQTEDRVRESVSRYLLARVLWRQGQNAAAQTQIKQSLALIEILRTKVTRQDLRTSYLASAQPVYELAMHLWMERKALGKNSTFAAQAWHMSERSRARSLLDALQEARALDFSEAPPLLVSQQRELQLQLNAARDQKTIKELIEKRNEVEAQLRENLPRYAALVQPEPLTLPQLQAELDSRTTLLEFSLGESQSYLWEITRNEYRAYRLPPRHEIEKAAQSLLLALRPGAYLRAQERRQAFDKAVMSLSQMLLSQVAPRLGQRSLLIVADGVLQYIPFAALHAAPGVASVAYQPLMLQHEISYLPSASTLALLRAQSVRRHPASQEIQVFADPRFSLQEEPLKNGLLAQRQSHVPLRAADEAPLVRLHETQREAQAILALAPDARVHIREDANVAIVKQLPPRHYRVVHFATHAKPDRENPELSAIFFAAFDEHGQPQESRLHLQEIYQLPWSAELVVLSACETALGQEIKGEGLVNLARGFMYAGSPRILASLWKVDDLATFELMQVFYRQHLSEGKTPRAALRAAQHALWQSEAWNGPWHWAAFTLQGEFL